MFNATFPEPVRLVVRGLDGSPGPRPARPAVNIHSFIQRYVPERSAELLCLPKQVFPAFGSCNGHVTAITSEAELNVGGKSLTLGSVCSRILLLFCCYCSTLQHCSALNVGVLYAHQ